RPPCVPARLPDAAYVLCRTPMSPSRPGRCVLASLVLLLSTSGPSCGSSAGDAPRSFPAIGDPAALPALSERVGMAHQLVWGDEPAAKARRDGQLARLRSIGIRNVRMDFVWHWLEKSPGEWDFSELDPVVRDATDAG